MCSLIADDPKKGPAGLRKLFAELEYPVDAFSAIEYLGVRKHQSTPPPIARPASDEFSRLRELVVELLGASSYRQPRRIDTVFKMLAVCLAPQRTFRLLLFGPAAEPC